MSTKRLICICKQADSHTTTQTCGNFCNNWSGQNTALVCKADRAWVEYSKTDPLNLCSCLFKHSVCLICCHRVIQYDLYLPTQSNCQCIKCTAERFPRVTSVQRGGKQKQTESPSATWGKNCEAIRPEERLEMRYEEERWQESSFSACFDRQRGRQWDIRGREGDGAWGRQQSSKVVPVWREKALCSLPVDRPVKLRRAQAHRPEGFTGLCSFLCGSSVSTTATIDPPAPACCPLRVQLHDWSQAVKGPPQHLTVKGCFCRKWIRGLQSNFHFPPQPKH